MPRPGARAELQITTFTEEMRTALGEELVASSSTAAPPATSGSRVTRTSTRRWSCRA